MTDPWSQILEIKNKRNSLREKLQRRKKERQDILNFAVTIDASNYSLSKVNVSLNKSSEKASSSTFIPNRQGKGFTETEDKPPNVTLLDPEIEKELLYHLSEVSISLPVTSEELSNVLSKKTSKTIPTSAVINLLQKFSIQRLISIKDVVVNGTNHVEVVSAEHSKILEMANELYSNKDADDKGKKKSMLKRKVQLKFSGDKNEGDAAAKVPRIVSVDKEKKCSISKELREKEILSLLSKQSIREKEVKKIGEEILELLSKPTAKERSLAERFKSQGAHVKEFCPHKTKSDCVKVSGSETCTKLHFKKIIHAHTDEALGDCSFLNTCFHVDTCRYVHYEVDALVSKDVPQKPESAVLKVLHHSAQDTTILYPPQWIQCDLRFLDMTVLGKFAVIMADPPWDIHMELPYGTMSDDEMRKLPIPVLQDEGLLFLWVTGRAMELGRECLRLWGYERVDEIIWVKTNQLQRIIRTGRTGHWLNHGKEHCLVGMKGNPKTLNRGLDCDVITAEVRATSHKPDEIYGIIERLSPGTRKIELFGRSHNVQPNWLTLGNQVDGVRLVDPCLIEAFRKRYPDGNCMEPPKD